MRKHHHSLSAFFFLVGLALLYKLIQKVGTEEILTTFHKLDWKILYILILPTTWYSIQTLAWYRVLHFDGQKTSFGRVFLAKIAGEAVNTVTPLGFAGGDPVRIYLLQMDTCKTASTASVVIDRTMQTLGIVLMFLTTLIMAWLYLPLPRQWRTLLPLITIGFVLLCWGLVRLQHRGGTFVFLSKTLGRFGIKPEKLKTLTETMDSLDKSISAFYKRSHAHFFEILFYQYLGRLLGVVEIFLIAHLLGYPITITHALFLSSLSVLINIIFVFIPGSMGIMEGGYGAVFHLLKLNPAMGIAIQLFRRLRTFFWIFLGLLVIPLFKPKTQRI
jgi:uncharacterized protein (TIRG00374 family)